MPGHGTTAITSSYTSPFLPTSTTNSTTIDYSMLLVSCVLLYPYHVDHCSYNQCCYCCPGILSDNWKSHNHICCDYLLDPE